MPPIPAHDPRRNPSRPHLPAIGLALFLAASGAHAQTGTLPNPAIPAAPKIMATFYDHVIADFDGEFGARKPGVCGYSVAVTGPTGRPFDAVTGMVRDTLTYSKEARKKFPAAGSVDCNSLNLEKWFLPSLAAGVACKELVPTEGPAVPGAAWKFGSDAFFPIDDIAGGQLEGPGPAWEAIPDMTIDAGFQGPHNYNWCMEINAQFTYRGGETFRFRGDDDVWVFLDDRLIVDLGGIHGGEFERTVLMDTLPFLAGKRGEAFDFDMYSCERRPSGSSIHIETDLELKPARLKDLEIVRADGTPLNPKSPVVGKTRLCALPEFPVRDACGNLQPFPAGPFHPAAWTLDGAVAAADSACFDLDPDSLAANRLITLKAKAEGKSAILRLQVLQANVPAAVVLKGNGRLEEIAVHFRTGSDSLFAPMRADIPFAGGRREWRLENREYLPHSRTWKKTMSSAEKGPAGVSGVDSASALLSQTITGIPVTLPAPLVDSISPVVRAAAWLPTRGQRYSLVITPSESLAQPLPAHLKAFRFKGKSGSAYGLDTPGEWSGPENGAYRITLPADIPFSPRQIDSVTFSPAVADGRGNTARTLFVAIAPPAFGFARSEILSAGLEANPVAGRFFVPFIPARPLVLLDGLGEPMAGTAEARRTAEAGGPILAIRTLNPLDRVELSIYTNLGGFVGSAAHAFTEAEWSRLKAGARGDTVIVRMQWYPASRGAKLGTGVYVLKGAAFTRSEWEQGPDGSWREKASARVPLGPWRFGYLR